MQKLQILSINANLSIDIFLVKVKCPDNYKLDPFAQTCQRLVTLNKQWEDAKNYCEADGEYLATFENTDSALWFVHQRKTDPGKYSNCLQLIKF